MAGVLSGKFIFQKIPEPIISDGKLIQLSMKIINVSRSLCICKTVELLPNTKINLMKARELCIHL